MIGSGDRMAIHELVHLYGHAADEADADLLREVFEPEAVIDLSPLGRGLVEGLDEICAWFALGKPPHPPAHHTTNVVVRAHGDSVAVWSKWYVVAPRDGSGATGDYRDVVVPTADGWRIRRRVISSRFPPRLDFTPMA